MTTPKGILGKHLNVLFDKKETAAITGAIKQVLENGKPFFLGQSRATWGKKWRTYKSWVTKYDKYRCAVCGVPVEGSGIKSQDQRMVVGDD